MTACSIFGNSGVEIAPYKVFQSDGQIEIRQYEELVLVSTPMNGDMDNNDGAFNKLFDYISGANKAATKIEMTAPVIMDPADSEGQKIAMTTPVLVNPDDKTENWTMSFVLPGKFDYDTAPRPTNPDLTLEKITDLTVAVIRFNGLLRSENTQKHREQLERWIAENGFKISGPYKAAGYNPPWTLPNLRRNEVIIPIEPQ